LSNFIIISNFLIIINPNRFLSGMLPFGEETDDPQEIFDSIQNKELVIPEYVIDKNAINLI
jgi:hypothetical protein